MAAFRKHQRRVVKTYSLKGLKMGNSLFTDAPSGLYEARFVGACIEETRRGTHRLLMKFQIVGGPCSLDGAGAWKRSTANAGRILPLWAELKWTPEKELTLSPNHWIAPGLEVTPGKDLEQKINSDMGRVRWVCVRKEDGHPAQVNMLAYNEKVFDVVLVRRSTGGAV